MRKPVYAADASAMIAFLRKERGYYAFRRALRQPGCLCYAHVVNLAEVFYDFRRQGGEETAQEAIRLLLGIRMRPRQDTDPGPWQDAARIKADYIRVSVADCFGVALARRVAGVFLSTDHHELDALAEAHVCRVQFIR